MADAWGRAVAFMVAAPLAAGSALAGLLTCKRRMYAGSSVGVGTGATVVTPSDPLSFFEPHMDAQPASASANATIGRGSKRMERELPRGVAIVKAG